jgi:branched-chain amino acid transport system substrate-binding protein
LVEGEIGEVTVVKIRWLAALGVTLLVAITAGPTQGGPAGAIRLAFVSGLTGPGAFVAEMGRQGVLLAVEEINRRDGVLGRQLDVTVQDSKANPIEAINTIRRVVTQDGIKLIIGPQTSSEVLAALPVTQELQVVTVTTMSTNPAISQRQGKGGNPWMFRVNPPDDAMARAIIRIAITQLGDRRIATVARNDDLGRGATQEVAKNTLSFGGVITSNNFFTSGGMYDFSSTLTRLKQESPQAVIFVGTIEEGIPFIKQFAEQGLKARIYTRGVSITDALYQALGPLANGLHAVEPYFAEIATAPNRDFVARFNTRWNRNPVFQAYMSYAAVYMLAEAIRQAGTDAAPQVRDQLTRVRYKGVTGDLAFNEFNQAHASIYVGRVDCPGNQCRVVVITSAPSE